MQSAAAAFAIMCGLVSATADDTEHVGRVISVADGDTVTVVTTGNKQLKIRLACIDAPEKAQAFGKKSKQSLSELVFGKTVRVIEHDTDRYGRIVGTIRVDEVDANLTQVQRGLAWVYRQYCKDAAYFKTEAEAQKASVGLWADARPTPPWEYRRSKKTKAKTKSRKSPEAFLKQLESFVTEYVKEGLDRSSAGLRILCAMGKESCGSADLEVNTRCLTVCERYRMSAARRVSKTIEITGMAQNAKGGAVLVTDSKGPIYILGLGAWPDALLGNEVAASGSLTKRKLIPDPVVSEDGGISQGAHGSQWVLENAEYAAATAAAQCGSKTKCSQMTSCKEARFYLACGVGRLDGDKDGVPCEALCK